MNVFAVSLITIYSLIIPCMTAYASEPQRKIDTNELLKNAEIVHIQL